MEQSSINYGLVNTVCVSLIRKTRCPMQLCILEKMQRKYGKLYTNDRSIIRPSVELVHIKIQKKNVLEK